MRRHVGGWGGGQSGSLNPLARRRPDCHFYSSTATVATSHLGLGLGIEQLALASSLALGVWLRLTLLNVNSINSIIKPTRNLYLITRSNWTAQTVADPKFRNKGAKGEGWGLKRKLI